MLYRNCRWWFGVVLLSLLALALGCSETDIPQSPEAPFLLTDVVFTNDISPRPFTTLRPGQAVNFDVGTAYTLAPDDGGNIRSLAITLDFDVVDSNADFIRELGRVPDKSMPIDKISNISRSALSIALPANLSRIHFVRVFAALGNASGGGLADTLSCEVTFWPLR